MKDFKGSIFISLLGLCLAGYWGFTHGGVSTAGSAVLLAFLLAAMEVSLSFDNAVVNAGVLKDMTAFWRKMFLTIGIFVAVFGMRLVFPIAIVSVSSGVGMMDVMQLALDSPDEYARQLTAHHIEVSVYGGIFLLLVFLNYFFDDEKDTHWLHWLEAKLGSFGHVRGISPLIALTTIIVIAKFVDAEHAAAVMTAGAGGIATYLAVDVIGNILDGNEETGVTGAVTRSGIGAFLYLEVLDASFSFDGVIGAFAITKDIVIIMIGLGIGAMFVRSITMYLVDKGTLSQYRYLEHGAHYAIGALAVIMLASLKWHIPEVVTGLVGIALIGISVWSSMKYNKADKKVAAAYDPQVDAFAAKFWEKTYEESHDSAQSTDTDLFVITVCTLDTKNEVHTGSLISLVLASVHDTLDSVVSVEWVSGKPDMIAVPSLLTALRAGKIRSIKIDEKVRLTAYEKAYYTKIVQDVSRAHYRIFSKKMFGSDEVTIRETVDAGELVDYVNGLTVPMYDEYITLKNENGHYLQRCSELTVKDLAGVTYLEVGKNTGVVGTVRVKLITHPTVIL